MPFYRLRDYERKSQAALSSNGVNAMDLYTATGENVGKVSDILVDPEGHYRYLIVALNLEVSSSQVLLPVSLARFDYRNQRVYVNSLNKTQITNLPKYNGQMTADKVIPTPRMTQPLDNLADSTNNYDYQQDPDLYELNQPYHQTLKLYEERLIARNHQRIKSGEVAIAKKIKTENRQVSVPLVRERVVIERLTPVDIGATVGLKDEDFQAREILRIELYDNVPDISKEAFVREEVRVKKVAEQYRHEVTDTVRREELDIVPKVEH